MKHADSRASTQAAFPSRREAVQWVGAGLGALALGGCGPRADPRYVDLWLSRGQRRFRLRLERRLRRGPLTPNETAVLRRYHGRGLSAAREAQLLHLTQTAAVEEAFMRSEPDGVWTEIGTRTERGDNVWGGWGVRHLPPATLLRVFGGNIRGLPRAQRLVNYHYHPQRLAAPALRRLGLPPNLTKMLTLPSAADLAAHARLKLAFAARSIPLASRVAVDGALVSYDVADPLARRIVRTRRSGALLALRVWEAARRRYAELDVGPEDFRLDLAERLRQHGFPPDLFAIRVEPRRLIHDPGE